MAGCHAASRQPLHGKMAAHTNSYVKRVLLRHGLSNQRTKGLRTKIRTLNEPRKKKTRECGPVRGRVGAAGEPDSPDYVEFVLPLP